MLTEEDFLPILDERTSIDFVKQLTNKITDVAFFYTTARGKKCNFRIRVAQEKNELSFSLLSIAKRTQEIITKSSLLAHDMKNIILEKKEVRLLHLTGNMSIRFSNGLKDNVEEYKEKLKKRRKAGMKKAEVLALKDELLSFYEEAKTKAFPKHNPNTLYEINALLVSGLEARHLSQMVEDLKIASWGKWGSDYHLSFNFNDFVTDRDTMIYVFRDKLKELGFRAYVRTWYD